MIKWSFSRSWKRSIIPCLSTADASPVKASNSKPDTIMVRQQLGEYCCLQEGEVDMNREMILRSRTEVEKMRTTGRLESKFYATGLSNAPLFFTGSLRHCIRSFFKSYYKTSTLNSRQYYLRTSHFPQFSGSLHDR